MRHTPAPSTVRACHGDTVLCDIGPGRCAHGTHTQTVSTRDVFARSGEGGPVGSTGAVSVGNRWLGKLECTPEHREARGRGGSTGRLRGVTGEVLDHISTVDFQTPWTANATALKVCY